jgi:hypothetical protein
MKNRMDAKIRISLLMAIPDHPWTKVTKEAAAVRIAMTVAASGAHIGQLRETTSEAGLETDQPQINFAERTGRINADLTVGIDVTSARALRANEGLCSPGVKLHGSGFIVTRQEAEHLGLGKYPELESHIRPYRNGRDLTARPRGVYVIDLFRLDADSVRKQFPEVYQHVLTKVKPDREAQFEKSPTVDAKAYLEKWWVFGKPRTELRPALEGLRRYIATVETAKHRILQFLPAEILPDNMLVCIADEDTFVLGILSSRPHVVWALRAGGWLGVGNDPRYSKSKVFDPFPFPSPGDLLKAKIRTVAEELDAFRKARQNEHPDLTLTQMYNVLEKLRTMAAQQSLPPPPPPRLSPDRPQRRRGKDQGQGPYPHSQGTARAARRPRVRGLWLARDADRRTNSGTARRAQPRARGGGTARPCPLAAARLSDPALRQGSRQNGGQRTAA